MSKLMRFFKDEDGVTAIEYGIIAALIILVCILAITDAGTALRDLFRRVATELTL